MAGSRRNRSANTRRRENTRGRNTSLSNIKKREEETKNTNQNSKIAKNTQKSSFETRNTGFQNRRNNNRNTTIGNPRRQTGAQRQVQQKKNETANRLAQLTKGNLQTIAGSHETTFNAIRNPMEKQYTAAQKLREQRGEKSSATMGVYEQLLNRDRTGMKEIREANLEKAAKKIKKGEKNIEKSTEELGSVGKFAADLYGAGLGMAADALAGPAATASLLSRSFGSAYNRAKEEGADDSQAALYGAAVGGLEAGSERLFAVATPLRKLYGAGAGDELTEKVLQKLVSKAGKEGAKTAIYNGGKVFGSALTEALEEMVVEGLEPAVANQVYAEAVGMPHETSAKDVLYAGLMGGVMGGVLGGAGQIVDHRQGRRVQEVFGENGVLDLAKKAADSDESIGKSLTGAALAEMINNGEAVVAGQANDLYKTVQRQEQKDAQRMQDSMAAADNMIQQSNYVEPSVIDPQTGEELLRRTTANKLEEVKAEAIDISADMQLPDMSANQIAESVARIMTGTAKTTDVNLFAKSNPAAREVYARMTGKTLPDSNEGTRDFLWNQVAQNRVATAEAETLDVADRTKGIIEQRMGDTYEASGQALFAQKLAGIDSNDTASLEATVVSFDDFYRAGRRNLPMDDVMAMGNPFHARVPKELREAAYNAGQQDRFRASDTAKGMQLALGQTAKENRSTGRKTGSKGKLMTEALSEEMRQELPATQMALLRTLARTFNINIHVVDTLAQQEGEASPNGFYVDGEVYLSMTGDRPLPYIFAHEITHHMQVYAPKEYNQLKELVRRRWGDQGGMDAAIDAKRAHYAKRNVSLSYEDALDEIIADSTYEILQDEGFVDELCRSHRNIAQALLDAIKNVISKIRATLAEGELFTPAQNANLLSELDILKDFERIWANGLMRAAENRNAVGTVSEMENVRYQFVKDKQGKNVVIIEENIFDGMMPNEKPHQYIADFIASEVGKSYKILSSGYKVYIGEDLPGEFTQSKYTQSLKRNRRDRGLLYAKNQSAQNFGEVIEIADDGKYESNTKPKHAIDAKYGFYKYRSRFAIKRKDGNATEYDVELVVRHDADGKRYLYDITDIKKVGILHLTSTTQGSHGYGGANIAPQVTPTINSIPDSQQNDNKKFSLSDAKYMAAVEKGDMETAQMMVNEAAEAAMKHSAIRDNKGKLLKVYHGTNEKFNSFNDPNHTPYGEQGNFYFSPWRSKSEEYGDNIRAFYLNIERPRLYDENFDELNPNTDETDGFIFIPEDIEQDIDQGKQGDTEIVAYYPDQIKSADPVTYDDDGNVIPLSERFNSQNDDIRYSLADIKDKYQQETDYLVLSENDQFVTINNMVVKKEKRKSGIGQSILNDIVSYADEVGKTITLTPTSEFGTKEKLKKWYKANGFVENKGRNIDFLIRDTMYRSPQKRYSLPDTDSTGRELSEGQKSFFKNSQMRNEEGKLIPMYHGTSAAGFTVFNVKFTDDERSFFFTSSPAVAKTYSGTSDVFKPNYEPSIEAVNEYIHEFDSSIDAVEQEDGYYLNDDGKLVFMTSELSELFDAAEEYIGGGGIGAANYEVYLNLENPLIIESSSDNWDHILIPKEIQEDMWEYLGERIASTNTRTYSEYAQERGHDGVIFRNITDSGLYATSYEKFEPTTVAVAFDSEQIKDVNNLNPTEDKDIRYSLADTVEETNQKAIDYFGETDSWEETGYLLTDGRQLDFSGRHWGSDGGGRREVDHRDIWDAFEPAGMQGFDAMMAFMNAGNIRIMPETPGIDIAVMPTSEQEEMLEEYIEYFGGDITLDIDNGEGVTVSSTTYPMGTSSSKILNDIRTYFTTGEKPYVSEVAMFRYSLPDEEAVYDYINTHETEFVEVPPVKDYERAARTVQTKSVEELQKQVEILKRDKRLTHGKELDKASIKPEMTELIKVLMSHSEGARGVYDRKLVNLGMENANIIYRAFKDGDMASVTNTAYYAAKEIVENLKFIDDTAFIHYKELRDIMKDTAVTISEADKADIPDYSEFYKSTFGRLKIVNEGGMPVDDLYATLAEAYPDLFDPELTHPADQLMAMADVREALEPYDVMLSAEETEQLIKETAHDLIEVSLRGKPWKSWADRQKEVYDNKLKTMKAMHKEALNDLRIKERMRATRMVDREKLKAKEYKEKQKDGKARAKANGSIMKNYKWLADRLVKPTDDKHIPDGFRKSLADMLQAFDLQSARSKALEEKYGEPSQKTIKMRELRDRLSEIAKEDDTGVFQYDGYVFDLMNALADKLDGKTIREATTEDLASIDTLLKAIVTNIRNYNKAFSDDIKATISELAEKTIEADNERIAKRGKKADRSGIIGGADSMLNESMVSPRDFFEQIGGGVQEAFLSMRKGFDKHVDNLTKTREFFDSIFTPYNKKTKLRKRAKPGSIIEKWRDTTFQEEFQLESGKTIKLNPAQMMTLYCLMKREQAQGHIFGSGIVASKVDNKSKFMQSLGAKIQPQGSAVMITLTDAENIISKLTRDQIEMADKLQGFLNGPCAEWGNEASLTIFGYKKFTEENYFPIKSADQYLDSNFESRQAAERIKNFGFTKGTVVNANNPIMIDDIFRVVADHINKMSLYNAFAAPISDFTRVYNYKSRDDSGIITGSVKASLEDAHGKKALNYINNFMADLNNQAQTRTEGFGRFLNKSLANYKKAMIGGNLRVAFQQPTAVVRAFMLMSPKYFVNAHVNPIKNLRDMKEHCQIARWKSWGHNQVDMARDIDEIMMNNEWTRIDALTMKMYGGLDNLTWSTIWAAIRKETAALHPEVKVNSEEFYAICNDRASEVFDKTQVVDSVFHRSEIMRSKDTMSKMVTSFMAEPTRTFNMVRTEMVKAREEWKDGNKGKAVAHANRTLSVFMINAAMVSAAAAIADALRDKDPDDDGEDEGFIPTWLENFWANFWGNVNPANMIPVVNDIWGFTEGWGSSNMALDGYDDLVKSVMALADPEKRDYRKVAESIATVFGIPLKNSLRELEIIFGVFGIEVFAAEAGEEEEEVKQPLKIKTGSKFDNFLNKIGINRTESEKLAASFDKRVKQYNRSTKNMTEKEKQDYLWKQITANYTTYIKDGNFAAIKDMRAMLEATGGDYETFDERVLSETKTAMRKSIGVDEATLNACKNFLIDNYEYTEGKISAEILSTSDTATDFQLALCTNDFDGAVDALSMLRDAGITKEDAYTLFINRSKAIKAKDYSTGEFVSPVDGEISSGFGYRDAPTAGASTYHQAIDIAAPAGSPVVAADGGKVTKVGYNGGYGISVTIDHGNGKYTIYNHLQEYNVQKGDAVTKGQQIAKVGSTGISTGPHLDFQVRVNGTYVDPTYFL